MRTLERLINHRLLKAYFVANVLLANLHVGIVILYFFVTGSWQQMNLFHLLGIHLLIPRLGDKEFLSLSIILTAVFIAIVYRLTKHLHVRFSSS